MVSPNAQSVSLMRWQRGDIERSHVTRMIENVDPNTLQTPRKPQQEEDELESILGPKPKVEKLEGNSLREAELTSNLTIHSRESHLKKPNANGTRTKMMRGFWEESQKKHHNETRRNIHEAKDEILREQKKEIEDVKTMTRKSAMKQNRDIAALSKGIGDIKRNIFCLMNQNVQAQSSSLPSGVLGGVVSVGEQSSVSISVGNGSGADFSSCKMELSEDDNIPFNNLYKEKYEQALKAIDLYKKDKQAIEMENKSLLEQLDAQQSKRAKRPEDIIPANTRMPPNVEAKQKRAEEQAIALKIKGRRKKSEILASSNLPTPYKYKLRSRSDK